MKTVRINKETFEQDLENCLTILDYPNKEKDHYVCEYITPGLEKRIVNVIVVA